MSVDAKLGKTSRLARVLPFVIGLAVGLTPPAAHASLLFVANYYDSSLKFFNAGTGAFVGSNTLPGDLARPIGVALGPDGNIYVADTGSSAVDEYNGFTGAFIGQFIPAQNCGSICPASALNQPTGLVFGPDGNLYVANDGNGGNGYVNIYNGTTGAFMSQFVSPSAGLSYPGGLTFDSSGNLYIASNDGTIEEYNSSGTNIGPFVPAGNPPSPMAIPESMAWGPDGNLYVVDEGSGGYIDVFTAAGGYLGNFTNSPPYYNFDGPIDLAFGPGGHLYVTYGQGVAVFQGTFSGGVDPELADLISSTYLNNPQFMAFGPETPPVPEPATVSLFALGLLGLFASRRARRALRSAR
jgi:sugar lactone lactonase YvrE